MSSLTTTGTTRNILGTRTDCPQCHGQDVPDFVGSLKPFLYLKNSTVPTLDDETTRNDLKPILARCPNLRALSFLTAPPSVTERELRAIVTTFCPRLKVLELDGHLHILEATEL
ncbi:hypothetical protein BGW39_008936 [Mortierella sp. 14UC]|nr:hypothetical protein BGW39_008936 [Mortierella sp. 14UC]